MSQPALSLAIRKLEDELGGPLLSRSTRQVRLTPEGTALLPQAVQLLADFDNVRERAKQRFTLQRGHVAIAAMPSFAGGVLPGILREYRLQFPNVEVTVHDVINEQTIDMVESGRVELGCAFEPEGQTPLVFELLFVDRFIAIVPRDSALATLKGVSWAELLKHDVIALQRPSSMRQLLEESLAQRGMELRVALECHQLATASQMVAAGVGVSVVPSLLRSQVTALGARCVRLERPVVRQRVGLIRRGDQQLSAAAAALRGMLQKAFVPMK